MAKLLDNRSVSDDGLVFDDRTYHWFWGNEDLTNNLSQAEKNRISAARGFNYDSDRDLLRSSDEARARVGGTVRGLDELSDSTVGPLLRNIVTDPLAAPIESLGNKANEVFANVGIRKLLVFAALIFITYFAFVGGWLKRKL